MLLSKYGFTVDEKTLNCDINRLTNQLWKLIPMRENDEDWKKQLNSVLIEIAGLNEIFILIPQFIQILSKLEGLLLLDTDFFMYRKTIFETISLLQELKND